MPRPDPGAAAFFVLAVGAAVALGFVLSHLFR